MEYLNKAGKYISNHRILLIICVVAAFIIMANIATYMTSYEYFGNCNKKETFTTKSKKSKKSKNEKFTNNSGMSTFMEKQLENMQK